MDQIADMFVKIKNAISAGHDSVQIPFSQLKFEIAKIIAEHGYAAQVLRRGKKAGRIIEIRLGGPKPITGLTRLSRTSRRLYSGWRKLKARARGRGIVIVSTPAGVLAHTEAAKQKVGGELIGRVW